MRCFAESVRCPTLSNQFVRGGKDLGPVFRQKNLEKPVDLSLVCVTDQKRCHVAHEFVEVTRHHASRW